MPDKSPFEPPMRLPGAERAVVLKGKVCDYLLSTNHPIGRFKAAFFGALGYNIEQWERLQKDLLEIGQIGNAVPGQKSPYGQKYEVRGTLAGPSGRQADVVTVWIVLHGEAYPHFVTAFPGEQP